MNSLNVRLSTAKKAQVWGEAKFLAQILRDKFKNPKLASKVENVLDYDVDLYECFIEEITDATEGPTDQQTRDDLHQLIDDIEWVFHKEKNEEHWV